MAKSKAIYRKVNRGFQVTLPPKYRSMAHLSVGAVVSMKVVGNKLVIEPCFEEKSKVADRLDAIFSELDKKPALADSEAKVQALIAKEIKATRRKP